MCPCVPVCVCLSLFRRFLALLLYLTILTVKYYSRVNVVYALQSQSVWHRVKAAGSNIYICDRSQSSERSLGNTGQSENPMCGSYEKKKKVLQVA